MKIIVYAIATFIALAGSALAQTAQQKVSGEWSSYIVTQGHLAESIQVLITENEKLTKENEELKAKLEPSKP